MYLLSASTCLCDKNNYCLARQDNFLSNLLEGDRALATQKLELVNLFVNTCLQCFTFLQKQQ